jgi:NADH-quinone oxidoreductase subunit N
MTYQVAYSLPEVAVIVLILLNSFILTATTTQNSSRIVPRISIFGMFIVVLTTLIYTLPNINTLLFTHNYFSSQLKMLLTLCAAIGIAVLEAKNDHRILPTSTYIHILCNVLALMIAISTNNLLILYVGLELYSISLYFLMPRKAGVKYIVLSAIMSAIFLYGTSLCYLNSSSISFSFLGHFDHTLSCIIGLFLILSYLLFKANVAPFHTWSIELYDSSPLPLVLFLDSLAKFILLSILACICATLAVYHVTCFQHFLLAISIMSMLVGGICPFLEKSIKKFIAYSSVGHTGFALVILSVFKESAEIKHTIIYIFSYFLSSLCLFIGLIGFIGLEKHKNIRYFPELKGAIKVCPIYSYTALCGLLSMVGLPPFIGFVAKFNVFYILAKHNRYDLITIVSIYTILVAAYTVNVVRYIFMSSEENADVPQTNVKFTHVLSTFAILALGVSSLAFNKIENKVDKMVGTLTGSSKKQNNLLLEALMAKDSMKSLHESLWPSLAYTN